MGTADELLLSNSCCGCVKMCVVLVVVVLSYLWWNFGGIDDGSMDKATEDYLAGSVTLPAQCQVCSLIRKKKKEKKLSKFVLFCIIFLFVCLFVCMCVCLGCC